MSISTNPNKWVERAITFGLIVVGSLSGYLVDKTQMEDRVLAVEKKSNKNEFKLDEANLELILYRIDDMEDTMKDLKGKVEELDTKIDASTVAITNRINDRRR